MKKSIIALMGLFTLIACSEDSYQEADKMSETGVVENTGLQNSIKSSSNINGFVYNSPYNGVTTAHYGLIFEFNLQAPVDVRISPYVGPIYGNLYTEKVNSSNTSWICNPPGTVNPYTPCGICLSGAAHHFPNFFDPVPAAVAKAIKTYSPLNVSHGLTILQDCFASIPVIPTNTCANVPFFFDYNVPNSMGVTLGHTEVTILAENSKIFCFEYDFNWFGTQYKGVLKHQFGDDSLIADDYLANGWTYFSDFNSIASGYGYDRVVALKNNITGELAIAQRPGFTKQLKSELTVVHPGTNVPYTLKFRNENNKIVIEFKP